MATSTQPHVKLPLWLRVAINQAEVVRDPLDRQDEPRLIARQLLHAQREDDPGGKTFPVKLLNVSSKGVGFVSRTQLDEKQRLKLAPEDEPDDPVVVSVVHCTQTAQGYFVGAVIESA